MQEEMKQKDEIIASLRNKIADLEESQQNKNLYVEKVNTTLMNKILSTQPNASKSAVETWKRVGVLTVEDFTEKTPDYAPLYLQGTFKEW